MPDAALRDTENVPLHEDVDTLLQSGIKPPHAPDAWIDHDKTKVGWIPFNRHLYVFEAPRPLRGDRRAKGRQRSYLDDDRTLTAHDFRVTRKYKASGVEGAERYRALDNLLP